jgi:hypothetical protein
MASIISMFNSHFENFINDVLTVFPENIDLKTAKNTFILMQKTNPKMLVSIWFEHITQPYGKQISKGNIKFFLEKDYNEDLTKADVDNTDKIMKCIDNLRDPIRNMGEDNQKKAMKYIQNLTKLSKMQATNN